MDSNDDQVKSAQPNVRVLYVSTETVAAACSLDFQRGTDRFATAGDYKIWPGWRQRVACGI